MIIRRETPGDVAAIRAVTEAAFAPLYSGQPPVEPALVDELRACDGWLPRLSLVALGTHGAAGAAGEVVGHVVCTRGWVAGTPALGLGPLSVHPGHQRRGVGLALTHAVIGAADALDEPLVALLGSPGYYGRYGFRPAAGLGIIAPDPAWGRHFQVRTLAAYQPSMRGPFRYAEPFGSL